jgi:tight adherence protein B
MEEALSNLVRRIKSDDLDLMVTAIGVQQQVGGNLAEVLDTIAFTIRERVRIKGEIRTLTAQGRYSGYLVAFLPIAIAVTLNFINPEFMQPLFTQLIGQILLGVGGIMMAIGFFAIRKITDIKV